MVRYLAGWTALAYHPQHWLLSTGQLGYTSNCRTNYSRVPETRQYTLSRPDQHLMELDFELMIDDPINTQ